MKISLTEFKKQNLLFESSAEHSGIYAIHCLGYLKPAKSQQNKINPRHFELVYDNHPTVKFLHSLAPFKLRGKD